jgi:hypothetical protein
VHWCANFVAARADVYPPETLAGLTDFGMDHTKEADLYQSLKEMIPIIPSTKDRRR